MAELGNKIGDLCVWWYPPKRKPRFDVAVRSVEEGLLVIDTLTAYDQRRFADEPELSTVSTGLLCRLTEDGWAPWSDAETGETNPRRYVLNFNVRRAFTPYEP